MRESFTRELLRADFGVRVALFTNPIDIDAAMEQALTFLIPEPHVHRVIIDGLKPKEYASHLKKVLRDKGVTVKKLRTETDHARPALRLADCFAGLVRHHAEDPAGRTRALYEELQARVDATLKP